MEKTGSSQDSMFVELMGLTRERVMEFVDKNAPEERRDFVKETLVANPILLSVSSITFYCAALCQILGAVDVVAVKLKTYTQITAYIMQVRKSVFFPILISCTRGLTLQNQANSFD